MKKPSRHQLKFPSFGNNKFFGKRERLWNNCKFHQYDKKKNKGWELRSQQFRLETRGMLRLVFERSSTKVESFALASLSTLREENGVTRSRDEKDLETWMVSIRRVKDSQERPPNEGKPRLSQETYGSKQQKAYIS